MAGVDLPFMIHAGESNLPTNTGVVDAMLLGAERIGHGIIDLYRVDDVILVEIYSLRLRLLGYLRLKVSCFISNYRFTTGNEGSSTENEASSLEI